MESKHIDKTKNSFMANGHEYVISPSCTINRWTKYEDFQMLLGWGRSFQDMFTTRKKIHELLNAGKWADAAILNHNEMLGISQKLENRATPALMICTLFINRKDEDITTWSEEMANNKINDWSAEGLEISDFFHIAWNLVPGFIENFKEDIKNTSVEQITRSKDSQVSKEKG